MGVINYSSTLRSNINFWSVFGIVGVFLVLMGFAMLLPIAVDFVYNENTWASFLISSLISLLVGGLLWYFFKPTHELRIREGFLVVSLTWFSLSIVGALPYLISGVLPSITDAVFETMSGISTTGSTIFGGITSDGIRNSDIESLPKSILFWRSLTHWLGGMGIIVLSVAILPLMGIGGLQLYKAETPNPTADKLTPRVQKTAKLLWGVYLLFTTIQFVLLWVHPNMDWFDALNHSFSTMATGKFSTKNAGIQHFNSVYIDWITILFMFLAGINFAMHFRFIQGDREQFFSNKETRFYAIIILSGAIFISGSLWLLNDYPIFEALRHGVFQVVAIVSTTGFTTDNYEIWNAAGAFMLFLLFFAGGCAGSTSGGIKMIRWIILTKNIAREFKQIIHPKAILPLRIGHQAIDHNTQKTVLSFFILYIMIFSTGAFIISLFGYDILSSFGASIAALGNIGVGWGDFGPSGSYVNLPYFGKWVLILLMMVGRLEIFTVLIIFSPAFWKQ